MGADYHRDLYTWSQEQAGLLRARRFDQIPDAYDFASTGAERETGLPGSTFPPDCPWSFEVFSDPAFWPDGGHPESPMGNRSAPLPPRLTGLAS